MQEEDQDLMCKIMTKTNLVLHLVYTNPHTPLRAYIRNYYTTSDLLLMAIYNMS